MSTKLTLAAVVACLAAVAIFVTSSKPDELSAALERSDSEAPAVLSRPAREAPRMSARPMDAANVPDGSSRTSVAADLPALSEEPVSGSSGGWFLEGTLSGVLDPDQPYEVTLNVFCFALEENRIIAGRVNADGTYSVDLTPMFLEEGPPARDLLISTQHKRYAAGNAMLSVGPDQVLRDPSERTVLRRDLTVRPACGLRGRLVLDRERLRHAELAVFPMQDGEPAPDAFRTAEFEDEEEDGSFEFRSARPGEYVVVVIAPGLLPYTQRVSVPPRTVVELGTIDLTKPGPGAVIRGRVVLPDGSPAVARVAAYAGARPGRIHGADVSAIELEHWNGLAWSEDGFVPMVRRARSDEDGQFAIEGLDARSYALSVEDVRGIHGLLIADGPTVEAPIDGVRLEAGTCRIDVTTVDEGRQPLAVDVGLQTETSSVTSGSGDAGRVSFLAEIDRDYTITGRRFGFERAVRAAAHEGRSLRTGYELVMTASGERHATLELALPADLDPPLPQAKVTLRRTLGNETKGEDRVVNAEDGVLRLGELRAGTYDVMVEPNENSFGAYYESYYLPARLRVELASGQTLRRELTLASGGRVRVYVEAPQDVAQGSLEVVEARIYDASGSELDVRFVTRTYEGNVMRLGVTTQSAFIGEANGVYPNLPEGTYTLHLTHPGLRFEPITFTIRAATTVEARAYGQRE